MHEYTAVVLRHGICYDRRVYARDPIQAKWAIEETDIFSEVLNIMLSTETRDNPERGGYNEGKTDSTPDMGTAVRALDDTAVQEQRGLGIHEDGNADSFWSPGWQR